MDQQNSSSVGRLEEGSSFPRLSINHLLLLMLTVSFSLACVSPYLEDTLRKSTDQFAGGRKWQSITVTVSDSVAGGIKLFGFIVLLRGWVRGQLSAMAPGHWFFLVLGPLALYGLVSEPLYALLYFRWGEWHVREFTAANNALNAGVYLVGALVCARAVMGSQPRRWKICIAVLGVWLSCIALLSGSNASQQLWPTSRWYNQHLLATWGNLQFVFAGTFIIAAIIDGTSRVRRDWLHHLAIVTILLDSLSMADSLGPFLARWWSSAIAWFVV